MQHPLDTMHCGDDSVRRGDCKLSYYIEVASQIVRHPALLLPWPIRRKRRERYCYHAERYGMVNRESACPGRGLTCALERESSDGVACYDIEEQRARKRQQMPDPDHGSQQYRRPPGLEDLCRNSLLPDTLCVGEPHTANACGSTGAAAVEEASNAGENHADDDRE